MKLPSKYAYCKGDVYVLVGSVLCGDIVLVEGFGVVVFPDSETPDAQYIKVSDALYFLKSTLSVSQTRELDDWCHARISQLELANARYKSQYAGR